MEIVLSKIDFKVMTWNHDIKTLFHLKLFEQGIDTSPPDYPLSHISEIEQEQWHKGFFTLWGIGAAISCLFQKSSWNGWSRSGQMNLQKDMWMG